MTTERTLQRGAPGAGGYRPVGPAAGEAHRPRTDLGPAPTDLGAPLLTVAHLSDLHVCDAQSPARAEFLDRWADADSPVRGVIGEVGTYRAQELLTAQVANAAVAAVNEVARGPVGRRPVDLAIVTGDNTDNAQANELDWYLDLLDGGSVHPDSGHPDRWEGVADGDVFDERFWHPETTRADLPRSRYGFPMVPGLLDAARAPFVAPGLRVPWLAVHGNHDRLLQGTVPAAGPLVDAATQSAKPVALPTHWSTDAVLKLVSGLNECDPAAIALLACAQTRTVTADQRRRVTTRVEFIAAHFRAGARPERHGFPATAAHSGRAYYRHDHDRVSLLVLDTVNEHGGWQGSLDREQLDWLRGELADADRERRYVVLASHHPLCTLVNPESSPGSAPRVLAAEMADALSDHPSVVLWLNGHTHQTSITAHGSWWEVTAPSLIDWPQQARIVELLRGNGTLTIATTMLDHAGPAPWNGSIESPGDLAALSRELSANDWQWRDRDDTERTGAANERNALLHLPDPWGQPGESVVTG